MTKPAITSIEHGELYAPEPRGRQSVILHGGQILHIAPGESPSPAHALRKAGLEIDAIDAADCIVIPGIIDPHAHLIGAGGEHGFATRQPEIDWAELVRSGVTTVVGCLGTDAIGRSLAELLCKARELDAHGLTAYIYTGSFQVPPPTLTGSVMRDIMLIDKVIGLGEIAIADVRSSRPTVQDLARLVAETAVAGSGSGKAGVTHFHVGPSTQRLELLHELLDQFELQPRHVYPTHVSRTKELMDDAIKLARRGCFVDTDTVEDQTAQWVRYYHEQNGPPDKLTLSSDAHTPGGESRKLMGTFVQCVREQRLPIERVLPHFTSNVATALRLPSVGALIAGARADLLVLDKQSLEIVHVIAGGQVLLRDGHLITPTEPVA